MSSVIRGDEGFLEQTCKHGVGHGYGLHTCDGCCQKLPQKVQDILDKHSKTCNCNLDTVKTELQAYILMLKIRISNLEEEVQGFVEEQAGADL